MRGRTLKPAPPMAMKIIIGKFGEDGEPIWFDVETNEWKDENGNWKDVSKVTPVCEKNYPLPLNVPNVPYIP